MTPEEKNIQLLAARVNRSASPGSINTPDVALAALCLLPMLDRIGSALERIAEDLEARG